MLGYVIEKSYTLTFFFYNKEKPPSASLQTNHQEVHKCIIIVSINS